MSFFRNALLIFYFFLVIIAIGSFFVEEPSYFYEIEGAPQSFEKGENLTYLFFSPNGNFTISYYFDGECFLPSLGGRICKENITVFPFVYAYPKEGEARVKVFYYLGGETYDFGEVRYSLLEELDYKGRKAILYNSSLGENYIVEKNTGKVLYYNLSTSDSYFEIILIEERKES